MKINIDYIDNVIELEESKVYSLEIENKRVFYQLVSNFKDISNGEIDDKIKFINFPKKIPDINILIDYFEFELSKKSTTDLYKIIANSASDKEKQDIINLNQKIIKNISILIDANDLPLTIDEELTFDKIIKKYKFVINKKEDLLNNIILIIDIIKIIKSNELLIFINLKQYLSKIELEELYKYIVYNSISVLLIDSQSYGTSLNYEKKHIIDINLDEFIL